MIASRIQADEILKIFPNFQGVIISEPFLLSIDDLNLEHAMLRVGK
jgi:hypothetical protein